MALSVLPGQTIAGTSANPTTQTILGESGLINALYGEEAAGVQAAGEQTALGTEAAGTQAEAAQYGIAGAISGENAQIAELSGQMQQYQNTRQLMMTLGTQAADISGAGFQESGTALNLARSSLQQGLLQNQVIGINANLQAGGYLEAAAATQAEQQAAQTTAATEQQQASTAGNLSQLATAEAATTNQFLQAIPNSGLTFGTQKVGGTTVPAVQAPQQPTQNIGGAEFGRGVFPTTTSGTTSTGFTPSTTQPTQAATFITPATSI